MRNFYFSADVSGRQNPVTGGPRDTHDGTIDLILYQRRWGKSTKALRIQCYRDGDMLVTRVSDKTGKVVFRNVTSF